MAQIVVTNGYASINSVDLSDHCIKIDANLMTEAPENTNFGSTGKTRLVGLTDWSVSFEFHNDTASGKVDATLAAIYTGRAAVTVSWKVDAGSTSTTNPLYSGSAIMTGYPVTLEQGGVWKTTATFVAAGALSRATS